MKEVVVVTSLLAIAVGGCIDQEQQKQQLINQLQAKCAAQGKKFVVDDVHQTNDMNPAMQKVTTQVTGTCVDPDAAPAQPAPPAAKPDDF